jgi:hypothetical protein
VSALLGITRVDTCPAVVSSCDGPPAHSWARADSGRLIVQTLAESLSAQEIDSGVVDAYDRFWETLTRLGRLLPREGVNGVTVVPMSAAVRAVRRATTMEEFGAALTQLRTEAGLSLKVLAARFEAARLWGLSKTTLSRSCNGLTLFQTEEQVVAFVTGCGETDATEWVAAWERALADRRAREHQSPDTQHAGPDTDAASPEMSAFEEDYPDDEVLGEFHVRFTRGHLRTAIVLSAIAGLAAPNATSLGVRNAGAVVLGLAAGLALLEQIRVTTVPTSLPGAA